MNKYCDESSVMLNINGEGNRMEDEAVINGMDVVTSW